jgi:nucleotide-binding universal stress UspA family protein
VVVASGRAPVLVIDPHAQPPVEPIRRLRGKRVIVALDGSEFAQAGTPIAAELARALDGCLHVLQTVEFPPLPITCGASLQDPAAYWPLWQADLAMEAAEASLQWTMAHLRVSFAGLEVTTQLVMGAVAEQLAPATSGAQPVGLVVMATHVRKGLSRLLLGSPAADVFRRDHLPLLLVSPSASPTCAAG